MIYVSTKRFILRPVTFLRFLPTIRSFSSKEDAYQPLPKLDYKDHPNRHFLSRLPEKIGVIGGGISGLCTAKELKLQGYDVEVLERNSGIGGVWFKNYPELGLQAPTTHYNLPDFPFPRGSKFIETISGIRSWLESYIEYFDLASSISLNSCVKSIEQQSDGRWKVNLQDKKHKIYDFLVLCPGMHHSPMIPEVKNQSSFKGVTLHSSQIENHDSLFRDKKVVVVGGGRSGQEISRLASDYTQNVTLVKNKTHLSIDPTTTVFSKYSFINAISCKFAQFFLPPFNESDSAYIYKYCKPAVRLYNKFLRFGERSLPEELRSDIDVTQSFPLHVIVADLECAKRIKDKRISVRKGTPTEFTQNGVLIGNEEVSADVVVFATGFKRYYFELNHGKSNLWLYRHMLVPGLNNICFLGVTDTILLPTVINIQAVWLCEVLRGKVKLPSVEYMNQIMKDKQDRFEHLFTEIRNPAHTWVVPEPFINTYLDDMQISTHRNRSFLNKWFYLPNPQWYESVVTHRI